MTLSTIQGVLIRFATVVVTLSNGVLAFAYTGRSLDCFLAGVWAMMPFLVFDWWAAPDSDSTTERLAVFVSTCIVSLFGIALFVGRVWGGLEEIPETLMFPVLAPTLLFALMFMLMIVSTSLDSLVARLGPRSPV